MRKTIIAGLATAAALAIAAPAAPAAASAPVPTWYPAPSAPFDTAAGARCDFAVHAEPIADEVKGLDLESYPDGSPKRTVFTGKLIIRLTNLSTGATTDADASGTALVDFNADNSQHWRWIGPVLVGFAPTGTNHPRGLFVLDGAYDMTLVPGGSKTVTGVGKETDLCAALS